MKTNKPIKSMARLAFVISAVAVFLISLSSCKKSIDSEQLSNESSNYKDDDGSVSAVTINVKTVGAVGDGVTDDTWAFNEAIDQVHAAGGGTVYVPAGAYLIDPDVSINMMSGVTLDMVDSTRILKGKPTATTSNSMIRMVNISNSKILGGKINGRRHRHLDTTANPDSAEKKADGEWGHGISIYACYKAKVIGTVIYDCWGDGIVIGSSNQSNAPNQSKNCVIQDVISRSNRRQGLTIGGVDSLIVENSKFTHTHGTKPQAGIDIEPDFNTAEKVYITNCEIAHNAGAGVELFARPTTTAIVKDIYVRDNYIHHNKYSGYVQNVSNVKFNYNRMINNTFNNNRVQRSNAVNSNFEPNDYN